MNHRERDRMDALRRRCNNITRILQNWKGGEDQGRPKAELSAIRWAIRVIEATGEDVIARVRADERHDEVSRAKRGPLMSDIRMHRTTPEERGLPSIAARALYRHVEEYLAGSLHEPGLEAWRLAIARATQEGRVALPEALRAICETYLKATQGGER